MVKEPMFIRVRYADLNARQQENYNFHRLGAKLADYGFNCLRLSDDWQGADLLACHIDGETLIKIQLKGRLCVDKKPTRKNIHIGFFDSDLAYVYPHDAFLDRLIEGGHMDVERRLWREEGKRSWPGVPVWAREWLAQYMIP